MRTCLFAYAVPGTLVLFQLSSDYSAQDSPSRHVQTQDELDDPLTGELLTKWNLLAAGLRLFTWGSVSCQIPTLPIMIALYLHLGGACPLTGSFKDLLYLVQFLRKRQVGRGVGGGSPTCTCNTG